MDYLDVGYERLAAPRNFTRVSSLQSEPAAARQAFSTWENSNSTGVERPNISTATLSRLFS